MSKPRMGAPRRVAVGLLAGSLAMFGVALAPSAGATTSVTTSRLAGTTRYGTAKAIATDASLSPGTVALVASGETAHLADALASSTLAGANAPAPIILTQTDTYTQDAKDGLAALKAKGVTTVYVVGGTVAVSDTVLNAIKADGFTTSRVADVDRFGTAAAVATQAKAKKAIGTTGALPTAIIANGFTYVDALAASAAAYSQNFPVLLVNADSVPAATSKAITDLGIKKVIIAGGTVAVSSAVQTALETATGNPATRLGGVDRNETAALIGDYEIGTLGYPATTAVLANGLTLVDALAVGPYAGQNKAPIVLTASLPDASKNFLDKYSSRIQKLVAAGGTTAISDADVTAAQTAAQTTSNDTNFSDAPELVSVALGSINATNGNLVLNYTFDEEVLATPVNAALFKLWTPYGESLTGNAAQRSTTDTKTVQVEFAAGLSTYEASVLTVATGAVQDSSGKTNPEGEVAGTTAQTFAGNQTRTPDLKSVTIVDATTADFTFDEKVIAGVGTGFHLISTTGTDLPGTAAVGQTDATVVRVTFASTANVARATVDASAVTSSTTTLANNLEAVKIGSGATSLPDLVSVTVDDVNDRVSFTFDETVSTPVADATAFHVFYRTAVNPALAANPIAAQTERSATDARTVVVQFQPGAINKAVGGAYVTDGAVGRESAPGTTNQQDEVGIAQSFTAGEYVGPQLVSATRTNISDSFGTATGRRIDFKFDQKVTAGNLTFAVYDTAGTRTVLAGCVVRPAPDNTTVRCDYAGDLTTTSSKGVGTATLATAASGAVSSIDTVGVSGTGAPAAAVNHEERTGIS